jgi:hypothetical protein
MKFEMVYVILVCLLDSEEKKTIIDKQFISIINISSHYVVRILDRNQFKCVHTFYSTECQKQKKKNFNNSSDVHKERRKRKKLNLFTIL